MRPQVFCFKQLKNMEKTIALPVLVKPLESNIILIRGQRVIIDFELARLYGVTTKRLNEQVKRNIERFPLDFMFQLTSDETAFLRSQNATSKAGRGGRRYNSYVFTEHGVLMAANVLNSKQAVEMSIYIIRAFIKLREILAPYKELTQKLEQLEHQVQNHNEQLPLLMEAVRELMLPDRQKKKPPIGYLTEAKLPKKHAKQSK